MRKRFGNAIIIFFLWGICNNTVYCQEIQNEIFLNERYVTDNKEVIINANVESIDLSKIKEITIEFDSRKVQKLIEDLMEIKGLIPEENIDVTNMIYNALGNLGYWDWGYPDQENPVMYFAVSENGYLDYLSIPENLNCAYLDIDHIFEYGYKTEKIPSLMNISSLEASENVENLIEDYSDFTFQSWNILAMDNIQKSDESGYYDILLQAFYEGVPISVKTEANSAGFYAGARYSSIGVFSLYGYYAFSKINEMPLENVVSLDRIKESFISDIPFFSEGEEIEVERIALEYYPKMKDTGIYDLVPVWTFDCVDTRQNLESYESVPVILKYSIMYYAENGKFCGVFY